MEQNNKSTVFLTVIAIATLLVAVIGASFAFFSANIRGNESASSIYIRTATLGITYDDGNVIRGENIAPGWNSDEKTFTIENKGDIPMTYHIGWVEVEQNFTEANADGVVGKPEELTYSLTCTDGTPIVKRQIPTTTTADIIRNLTIQPDATNSCRLTLHFEDTSSAQNYNQGKEFSAKINISADPVSAQSTTNS